jgi:hypothetical protein
MTARITTLLSATLWLTLSAGAQDTRSMIFGRLMDPQAMSVAGADIVVTNTDTNTSLTVKTNETGYFEADKLLSGHYRITVEAPGFKKITRSGIELPISTRTQVNFTLEVGGGSATLSVTPAG